MFKRSITGLLSLTVLAILTAQANAVICSTTRFKCDLDGNSATPKVTCKYVSCGGSCCLSPGSVIIEMSGKGFGQKDVGDTILGEITPLPGREAIVGSVVCRQEEARVIGELEGFIEAFSSVAEVADNGTLAETFAAQLSEDQLDSLDGRCEGLGGVAQDFLPFGFTLRLSIVNPNETVDKDNSLAAVCIHPDPESIVIDGTGAVTGGPYECDRCPFVNAGNGFADTAACSQCVAVSGEGEIILNGSCPNL